MPNAKPASQSIRIVVALLAVVLTSVVLLLFFGRGREAPPSVVASTEPEAIADSPAPDRGDMPVAQSARQTDSALLDARLTEAWDKIAHLEGEVASLHEQHKALEAALAAQGDRLRQVQMAAAGSESAPEWSQTPASLNADSLDEDLKALGAIQTDRGRLIRLDETQIRFRAGESVLPVERSQTLDAIADVLVRQTALRARIEVHTDNKGSASRNLELSQERARSVRDALVAMGVAAERLEVEGLGGTSPIGDHRTVASRQRNRRIEIYLITESQAM